MLEQQLSSSTQPLAATSQFISSRHLSRTICSRTRIILLGPSPVLCCTPWSTNGKSREAIYLSPWEMLSATIFTRPGKGGLKSKIKQSTTTCLFQIKLHFERKKQIDTHFDFTTLNNGMLTRHPAIHSPNHLSPTSPSNTKGYFYVVHYRDR